MKAALAGLAIVLSAARADAFCGFYVAGGDQQMFNDATQVVLMRSGTRTVLSMQNNYQGPPQDFAMVIPVPVVLQQDDVKTLPRRVFEHVEQMGAPRLVEYWEQDPCAVADDTKEDRARAPMVMLARGGKKAAAGDLGVTIEAKFEVGEYQIVILSAKDSTGLDTWLRQEHYRIPKGAEPLLRPYVESGSKFFVAKVDPQKVKFENGRAALSPLRFHYDSDQFSLPIRLGLANSSGTQDLIVNILAPRQRYEVANYPNVVIPTNLDVTESVKDRFGAFYTALFDRTLEQHPGAVVTEYAWQATTCDPCPGPALDYHDFALLGADVVEASASPRTRRGTDFVLTRLHARYGKDLQNDLEFRAVDPIVGGRELREPDGTLEPGAKPASTNNFQGRYAIRHPWTGPVACAQPVRGRWGGPPGGVQQVAAQPALGLAFAPRGTVQLASAFPGDVPEIGLQGGQLAVIAHPAPAVAAAPSVVPAARGERGCGCQSSDPGGLALLALLAISRPGRRLRRQRPEVTE